MNKFLSDALPSVNALMAVLIIFVPGIVAAAEAESLAAFFLGCLMGLILAIPICGTIAVLLNIRDEIVLGNTYLNDLSKKQN